MTYPLPSARRARVGRFAAGVGVLLGLVVSGLASAAPSEADVRLTRDIWPGVDAGPLDDAELWAWSPVSDLLFFMADDGVHGTELWTTDGTEAGTNMVADLSTGDSDLYDIEAFSDGVLMSFSQEDDQNHELWFSDGTAAGTYLVADINPSGEGEPYAIFDWNGVAYFMGNDGTTGFELWRSDGTEAGTTRVADINVGSRSSQPQGFAVLGDHLIFTADDGSLDDGTAGYSLWSTDGTEAGTEEIFEPGQSPGLAIGPQREITTIGGITYFHTEVVDETNTENYHGVFVTDGTTAGTTLLLEVDENGVPYEGYLETQAGVLFVARGAQSPARELWLSDGTPGGTVEIAVSDPQWTRAFPTRACNNVVFASDGEEGDELWVTDGAESGTRLLKDVFEGPTDAGPYELIDLGDYVIFGADSVGIGGELWVTDGTEAGTYLLAEIEPGADGSWPYEFYAAGNKGYFLAYDSTHGYELWVAEVPQPTGNCFGAAAPTTTTTTTVPSAPSTTAAGVSTTATGVLPATGGSSPLVVVVAVALLGLGTVATRFVRRA